MTEDQTGATAVEYGIMLAMIAVVIFGAVFMLGQILGASYDCTAQHMGEMPDVLEECEEWTP